MSENTMKQRSADTTKNLLASKNAYESDITRIEGSLFLKSATAPTDDEIEAAKNVVKNTPFISKVYQGDLSEALDDFGMNTYSSMSDGGFFKEVRPGIGEETEHGTCWQTTIEFMVIDDQVTNLSVSNEYEGGETTEDTNGITPEDIDLLLDWIKVDEDPTSDEATDAVDRIMKKDRKFREEQGQQDLFTEVK